MYRLVVLSVLCVVSVSVVLAGEGTECLKVGDCDCGEVCVGEDDKRCDGEESGCTCRPGCTVFDMYIRPGTTETVYRNRCHCPHTLDHIVDNRDRVSACTRGMWLGQPLDMRPYENNPNCYSDDM